MTTFIATQGSQRYAEVMLWIAWTAALWATFSLYLVTDVAVRTIKVLMVWTGRFAFIGGCLGLFYVVLAARTWKLILSGCGASVIGFVYAWWFLYALGNH